MAINTKAKNMLAQKPNSSAPRFFFFFWLHHLASRILVAPSEIKPTPPTLEAQSLKHWTTREVLPHTPYSYVLIQWKAHV